jgi:hypothetical protein
MRRSVTPLRGLSLVPVAIRAKGTLTVAADAVPASRLQIHGATS